MFGLIVLQRALRMASCWATAEFGISNRFLFCAIAGTFTATGFTQRWN